MCFNLEDPVLNFSMFRFPALNYVVSKAQGKFALNSKNPPKDYAVTLTLKIKLIDLGSKTSEVSLGPIIYLSSRNLLLMGLKARNERILVPLYLAGQKENVLWGFSGRKGKMEKEREGKEKKKNIKKREEKVERKEKHCLKVFSV